MTARGSTVATLVEEIISVYSKSANNKRCLNVWPETQLGDRTLRIEKTWIYGGMRRGPYMQRAPEYSRGHNLHTSNARRRNACFQIQSASEGTLYTTLPRSRQFPGLSRLPSAKPVPELSAHNPWVPVSSVPFAALQKFPEELFLSFCCHHRSPVISIYEINKAIFAWNKVEGEYLCPKLGNDDQKLAVFSAQIKIKETRSRNDKCLPMVYTQKWQPKFWDNMYLKEITAMYQE